MKNKLNSIHSLLDNDLFIQWVIHPDPELDAFWENEINKHEKLKENSYTLKNILKKLAVEEPSLSIEEQNLLWNNIKTAIDRRETEKKENKKFPIRKWIQAAAAVAAVLLLLAGGYRIYITTGNITTEINYTSMLDDGENSLQSENISLILPDDKVLDIRNDSSTVIYDPKGKVSINSEEIDASKSKNAALNQLIVPYGKTTTLTLSDGTKIWVNSGSKLIYPSVFDKEKREIYLAGEIYLDVTGNKERPFVIKTKHIDISVLGTKLNVSAYNDEAIQSVVLVSGRVSVKSKEMKGNYDIFPNQAFAYDVVSEHVDIREVNINNYISWIYGYLFLQSESLDYVIQKMEKHFNIPFTYNAKELKNIRVSGKLDLNKSPEDALKYIGIAAPISYETEENHIKIERISKK
jgi:ferric-dicitrate binding protein FerR (iron transport regulator)